MRKILGLSLTLALGLTALVAVPTAATTKGQPDGQSATACHLLADAFVLNHPNGRVDVDFDAKINVGNPERVTLAGDCDGSRIEKIDDDLALATSRPNGFSASDTWFPAVCGVSNNSLAAQDVTGLFKTGTHNVKLTVLDTCGGTRTALSGPVYLIVEQKAD